MGRCGNPPAMEPTLRKTITLNGEPRETGAATVSELLDELGLSTRPVATLRNGDIVKRDARVATPIADGDVVEVISMVGGG